MCLRDLELKDAELMLEWMHDSTVIKYMQNNFLSKTIDDCINFIANSNKDEKNIHKAIQDENGTYLGTVSLKNVEYGLGTAEFAITIRSCAMGKGVSSMGMSQILQYGINEIGLNAIYWCVSKENIRAIKFYDKNGYQRISLNNVPRNISETYTEEQNSSLIWYVKHK